MYDEIKGIDYILYVNKNDNKIYMLDLINNRNEKVENTGSSWNEAAYGNCLIALEYAKSTDALYLLTKEDLESIGKFNIRDTKEVEKKLKNNAIRIVKRQLAESINE